MKQKHRFLTALCLALFLLLCAPACPAQEAQGETTPSEGAQPEQAYSRTITIDGFGDFVYYAQNDPDWDRSLYEPRFSKNYRVMHGGGCAPTAAAIAIANLLTPQELPALLEQAADPETGFPYCPCAVNAFDHYGNEHGITDPRTPEDFRAALPVIFASYATGNNAQGLVLRKRDGFGTSTLIFETLANAYGLTYRGYDDWEDALAVLQSGGVVVTCVTRGIFTSSSHFMVIAAADEEYVYILDPLMREGYERDTSHLLEVVEPGLVRGRIKDMLRMGLSSFYTMKRPEE